MTTKTIQIKCQIPLSLWKVTSCFTAVWDGAWNGSYNQSKCPKLLILLSCCISCLRAGGDSRGYGLKWQPFNHFLKVSQANPTEYTPKTPKIARNFGHSNLLCHFPECFPPKLSPPAAGLLDTFKMPVPAWLHLWVLWTYLHGVEGCGWVNTTCLWSGGCFSLTGQLGCSKTLAQMSSIHTESGLSPNIHNGVTNRPFFNPTGSKYL